MATAANNSVQVSIKTISDIMASEIENEINHGATSDYRVFNKYDLSLDGNILNLEIKDVDDVIFSSSFLLALSSLLKQKTAVESKENDLAFHFDGKNQSGAAICLISNGLWTSEYSFENVEEENKFKEYLSALAEAVDGIEDKAQAVYESEEFQKLLQNKDN